MTQQLALLVLLLLSVPGTTVRAQRAGEFQLPPSNIVDYYRGVAVWQRVDGSVLRGYTYISVYNAVQTRGQPNGLILDAEFDFGSPSAAFFYPYLFAGKMDPNGRGFLRYTSVGEGANSPTTPTLDLGRVPVLLTGKGKVMSGGVLAADGSVLTFRVDFTSSLGDL